MNRYTRGLWAAFLLLVGALLTVPSQALAYDCTALVVDDAGALGSGIAKVEAAAQKLESSGAYVRVRTVNDFGGFADVDRYEADYEAHCPAWQDMNGGTKSNLLVFAVSFGDQRGAGLYYGDLWKKTLDAQWNTVLTDEVVPRLRDGDAPAAFVAGLDGIGEIVAATKVARTASSSGTAPVVVVQQPSQPTDLSGLWSVMKWVLLIVVFAIIGWTVNEWRRKVAVTRAAQQQARLAMQACVNYVVTAEQPLALAEAKVNGQAKNFANVDIQPLLDTLAAARRNLMAAQTEYGELQGMDVNPDKNGLTAGEYENLEARYYALLVKFRSATASVNGIDARITELAALAASAKTEFDAASGAIEAAGADIATIESAGFRVAEANTMLERAVAALGDAENAMKAKSFNLMQAGLTEANRLAAQAAGDAEAVRRGKQDIDASIAAQRGEAQRVDQLIACAGTVFSEISAAYAPESWNNINGNGSQAEQKVNDAEGALDAAEAAADMETQDWVSAREQIVSATGNIQRAEALANAIIALKRDLDAAKAAASGEIASAAADIRAACEYIARHDADIDDGLETRLDEAERALDEARRELAKEQPNYLMVVKAARAVNATADGILAKAQSEHEAIERLRQRAVTSLREAERSVDAANNYIGSHRSEVDSDAERMAQSAETALNFARRVSTLQDQIRYADQADQESDRALDMAKRDVREREEAREREARRQREAAAALVRAAEEQRRRASQSSSLSSGGFGSSGGRSGGSTSWGGGFGGRSGGSVSSGGRGGRGGGSVGW